MNDIARALLSAAPWVLGPAVTMWRVRRSRALAAAPDTPPPDAPVVSVIIPARDERRNIEASVRSALAATYRAVEVIVVDDHSRDGTGDLARAIAAADPRVRVISNPDLPHGWFGKPWACATGAAASRGDVLCFTDADARHGPGLVARAVHEMRERRLDLLSVVGQQELGGFWERVVQPHVFWMLAMRYGGTESVNRSRRVSDKIANGQCIFARRSAYEAVGGHGAVRHQVAEDVALAQRMFAAGLRTELALARGELVTRMYTSLGEVMAGWRKNIYAGGREAMPWGRAGQAIFPVLLVASPALTLAPPVVLALAAALGAPGWLAWGAAVALAAEVATWATVYRWMAAPVRYALLFPLGAAVLMLIAVQAIARGSRVEWKGRAYITPSNGPSTSR